jgi:hypothetical protein
MDLRNHFRRGKIHGHRACHEVLNLNRPCGMRVVWSVLVALILCSHIPPDGVRPLPLADLPSAPPISPSLPAPPVQIRIHTPPPVANTGFETRIPLLETLILGLADGRPLDELRFEIVTIYPELTPDFQPNWIGQHSNPIRAAAHRYRLRLELINVVVSEYAGLSDSDSDSD